MVSLARCQCKSHYLMCTCSCLGWGKKQPKRVNKARSVIQACNPSFSGGWDRKVTSSTSVWSTEWFKTNLGSLGRSSSKWKVTRRLRIYFSGRAITYMSVKCTVFNSKYHKKETGVGEKEKERDRERSFLPSLMAKTSGSRRYCRK